MQLARILDPQGSPAVGLIEAGVVRQLSLSGGQYQSLTDILESGEPWNIAQFLIDGDTRPRDLEDVTLLAPIDEQEIWAAGVTYIRSRSERMKESQQAASFYAQVYEADRPELFFKATPHRVAGPEQPVRIRSDASWNVPEPELALVLTSRLRLVGYTIGNDLSSRDIEGANPLYLPQAKLYDACCGLGPAITLRPSMPPPEEIGIRMAIRRGERMAFHGETQVKQMKRTYQDLIDYLGRDNSFPKGVILLTGTGIVPGDDFTLQRGDVVEITIDGIGTLVNPVVQG